MTFRSTGMCVTMLGVAGGMALLGAESAAWVTTPHATLPPHASPPRCDGRRVARASDVATSIDDLEAKEFAAPLWGQIRMVINAVCRTIIAWRAPVCNERLSNISALL